MKNNQELQKDVQDAINWEPLLNAAEIGVIAKNGVITLTGTVDSYAKKAEAENAAQSVKGVKAVVEKIDIRFKSSFGKRDDNEITDELLKAAKWDWQIPQEKINVKVENGWITLGGEVDWNYQKEAVNDLVKNHIDVKGVTNNITIKQTDDQVEKKAVEGALMRNLLVDDSNIKVNVSDQKVTLSGSVPTWYQKNKASRIAWKAPGVYHLDNELTVDNDF
jgi:osmotically-inducible protein OsmY